MAIANVVALGIWVMSWFAPVSFALPEGGPTPSQWNVFILAMQVHPWEATVPIVLCLDIALLVHVIKSS